MSSRIRIRTLKFSTEVKENLLHALNILQLKFSQSVDKITVQNSDIEVAGNIFYMRMRETNSQAFTLFNKINTKVAEIEEQLRMRQLEKNKLEQKAAAQEQLAFRERQLKREAEWLEYERARLELEQKNFIEAKKKAIINRAREKGYSVQEQVENGVVKLKLIKRIY